MTNMILSSKFISDLGQTTTIAAALNTNLKRLKGDLDDIIKVLSYTKTVVDDLTTLDNFLANTSDLLTFVSVIPEVGAVAAPFNTAVKELRENIAPVLSFAKSLDSLVKPLREGLQKLGSLLDGMISATGQIETGSKDFLGVFDSAYDYVQGMPDGQAKETSEAILNTFATNADSLINTLNQAMSTTNDVITGFYDELNRIRATLTPLAPVIDAINNVINVLTPVINVLNQMRDALNNIKIPIPIPYPHEASLYEIFRFFGSFSDQALQLIRGLLNDLLRALNITLPTIPGLADILNIHLNIPQIPDFAGSLKQLTDELNSMMSEFAKFNFQTPPNKI